MSLPDVLSPLAIELTRKALSEASPLVVTEATSAQTLSLLSDVKPAQLLNVPIRDADSANALLSGLWLGHDALEESHHLSQDIASPTGSFWHAIMHRREGDFSNAKYWYARCRKHVVHRSLGALTGSLVGSDSSDPLLRRLTAGDWDGPAFVDFVEAVYRRPDDSQYAVAVRLQQAEWRALFEHCALTAAGAPVAL